MEEKGRRNDGLDSEGVGGCYVDCCWGFDDGVVVALLVLEGNFREALMMIMLMMLLMLIIARNFLIIFFFRSHSSIEARISR